MTKEEIKNILPHRDNMLLLDEVERDGDTSRGLYHVRGDEFFLQGHFPGNPIVPGVVLCEILAQSACVLLDEGLKDGAIPVYAGLDKVRFRSPVKPGDDFRTECRITKARHPFYFAEGTGYVGDRTCITATFSFAITSGEEG